MREREVGLAVAVDVAGRAALGVVAVGDEVALPHHAGLLRILVPPQAIHHPAGGDDVRRAIVIDVEGPLAAIGDELAEDADGAVLMALPLAALRPGILIPVGAAHQIGTAVAVHIDGGDAFGMIGAQAMHAKGHLRNAVRAVAGSGLAQALRDCNPTRRCNDRRDDESCEFHIC